MRTATQGVAWLKVTESWQSGQATINGAWRNFLHSDSEQDVR
jgi:hypothetical protein